MNHSAKKTGHVASKTLASKREELRNQAALKLVMAYRNIARDFVMIGEDGETGLISAIAKVRSPVFCQMLDGGFKESKEKRIRFESVKKATLDKVADYIHFGEIPRCSETPKEDVEVFLFAEMYDLLELKEAMQSILEMWAKSRFSLILYQLCESPALSGIKKESEEFIKKVVREEVKKYKCLACSYDSTDFRCKNCGAVYNTKWETRQCFCHCISGAHSHHRSIKPECEGNLEKVRFELLYVGVSDETLAA